MATAGANAGSSAPTVPPAGPLTGALHLTGTSRVDRVRTKAFSSEGFAKVPGDIETETAVVTGSLAAGGRFQAQSARFSGTHRIDGDVRVTDLLRTNGTWRVRGGVSVRAARFDGAASVGGSLSVADRLDWTGALDIRLDVRATQVFFRGRMAVGGTLAARTISGEIGALSTAGAIEADWVEVRRRKSLRDVPIFLLPPPAWNELQVDRIEAAEVHLSGVRVRRLISDRIWLGPDTHVEYVEGTIVSQHRDAHVGPESESPPPPGLSR